VILFEIVVVALRAILSNVLRSALTCLGIIIGVGAVITMVGLGEGARQAVEAQISSMGTNLLYVRPQHQHSMGVAREDAKLTPEDADALIGLPSVLAAVPEMTRTFQIDYRDQNTQTSVTGTTPDYLSVENFHLQAGRFLNQADLEGRRRVGVIGTEVVRNLDETPESILGQTIKVGGVHIEVVGVLAEKGQASWFNPDDQLLVPITTARFRLIGNDRLRTITVQAASSADLKGATAEIERVLRRAHRIREGEDNDFQIRDQSDLRSTFEATTRTFSFLLAGIAAVSLLVGGIGIMNIMLVSVTERTREIGIRKAIGATAGLVLLQFLAEAIVLCLFGGLLGIGTGIGAGALLGRMAGWSIVVRTDAVVLSFSFAAAVGLFFGIYPAFRAARLDPIEALRYE